MSCLYYIPCLSSPLLRRQKYDTDLAWSSSGQVVPCDTKPCLTLQSNTKRQEQRLSTREISTLSCGRYLELYGRLSQEPHGTMDRDIPDLAYQLDCGWNDASRSCMLLVDVQPASMQGPAAPVGQSGWRCPLVFSFWLWHRQRC